MPQRFSATNYHHLSPPVLQRRSGDVPQSGRAEAVASMTFHVNTARLSRAGDEWQVGSRDLEARGRQQELGDGVRLPLIAIPAGEFGKGSPGDEPERASVDGPGHVVRLEGFLMGQTPVTQAQWPVVIRTDDVCARKVESLLFPINMCHQRVVISITTNKDSQLLIVSSQ